MDVERGRVTRRTVLDEALKLFSTQGYRSTSLELVSDKLGVTRQALYYHFRSKDDILGALFLEMMTKLETAAIAASGDPSEECRFMAMLRAHLNETVANTSLVSLLLHERPEIARIKTLNAARRRGEYARLFTEAYVEGVRDGTLLDMDPWVAVNALLAGINGVSWWYHGESGSPTDNRHRTKVAQDIFALMSDGYLTRSVAKPIMARRTKRASSERGIVA